MRGDDGRQTASASDHSFFKGELMAAKLMPSQEYLKQAFDYDPETGLCTWRMRPPHHFRTPKGYKVGNKQTAGKPCGWRITMKSGVTYLRVCVAGEQYLLHRLIWKWVTGEEPTNEVDHWCGDGTNNRWENLRQATHQQNQCNMKTQTETKAPRGVYQHFNRWVAAVNAEGKKHYLGTFATAEEAHQAYIEASERLHAEYSHTNRPETFDGIS